MAIQAAKRMQGVRYAVRDILVVAEKAKAAGKEMLYLNIGDPNIFDYETPPVIIEAIVKAMKDGHNGYAPSAGIPSALDAIRVDSEERGIKNIQDIFVANGCSEGIEVALAALCDSGDNILTPSPGYPLYTALVAKLGLESNAYFLSEENAWQPDLEDIENRINERTKAIVVINPNNPTGALCEEETLRKLIEIADKHDLLVISDEIYADLTLDGIKHTSMAALDEHACVLTFNGLSKSFLGPGLRMGWGVLSGPPQKLGNYSGAMAQLLRSRLSASHPVQHAVAPALQNREHLPALNTKLERRRDITVSMLNAIDGVSCVAPKGAFYAFPQLEDIDPKLEERFIAELIEATGVVVVHGGGFGQRPETAHFRCVFLPPEPILEKAYKLVGDFKADWRP